MVAREVNNFFYLKIQCSPQRYCFEIFYFNNSSEILVHSFAGEDEVIISNKYLLFNPLNKKINNITSKFKEVLKSFYKTEEEYNNIGIYSKLMKFQHQRIYMDVNDYITPVLSGDISFLYEAITMDADIIGPVIQNDTISALLYHANTENNESYIIPFDFSLSFEKSMGIVYKDQALDNELLAGFDKIKLSVLKNLIFARHNYGFKNPYYQAFFNLFAFYHNPAAAKSRRSDVSGLLTETDNKNLEIINMQMLKIK